MKNRKKPIIITLCSLVLCMSLVLGIMYRFPIEANAVELVASVNDMSSGGVSQSEDNGDVFNDGAKVHVVGWHGDWDQYNKPWEMALDAWWNDSVYTYDATAEKWRADNNMRWQNGEDQHNFVAWSPENIVKSTENLEKVYINLTGNYKKDDILLARSYDQKRPDNNKLDLQFEHLMARLDVNLRFKDYYTDVKDISVTANLFTEATCNFFTGKVESGDPITKTVNLTESHTISGYNWSGSCITVPQEINLHDVGLTINFTAGGEQKQVKLQADQLITFESGKRMTYNLTIGNDVVELDKVTATDWADCSDDASEPGKQQMTDEFTLVLSKQGNRQNIETHEMSFSDSGWNSVLSKALPAEAFAYKGEGVSVYEYSQGWQYNVTLQKDQSTPEKLAAADVMIATSSVMADVPLDLNFEHYFAKMTFIVRFGTEYADKDPELTDIKFMDDISCFLNTETESMKIIEVICNPTWIAAGGQIFTLKVDGVPNDIKLVEGAALQAGVNYLNLLEIGRDKVELTQVSEIGSPGGWSTEVNLDGATDTIGTADEGKTAWANGDQIETTLDSPHYGKQTATLSYGENGWTLPEGMVVQYLQGENITVTAVYASLSTLGMGEYISAKTTISGNTLGISFENVRTYSRLRIVVHPNQKLTVTATGFTPAGATESGEYTYALTADANGNAYLYGTFAAGGAVTVKNGLGNVLKEYTFENATDANTSYALNAYLPVNIAFSKTELATGYYEIKDLTDAAVCNMVFECKNEEQTSGGLVNMPASLDYEVRISAVYTDAEGALQTLADTDWINEKKPDYTKTGSDNETATLSVTRDMLTQVGAQSYSFVVQVRAQVHPDIPLNEVGQVVYITGSVIE